MFGKMQFFENCRREFHFCRREIDNTTFASGFVCRREIIWVRKTESSINFSVFHFAKSNSKNDKGNIIFWCIQGTICKSLIIIIIILNVNFFLFSRAKIVVFAEQDYRAWVLLLILNCFFKVSYKDNWNETLILLCKEFENNTLFLSLLNNHDAFDGKTTNFKISDTIQHNINFKKTLEKILYVFRTYNTLS